jgi:hypothetical protein
MTAIRLTITMEPSTIRKLDRVRGDVKRSTKLASLVKSEFAKQEAQKNV